MRVFIPWSLILIISFIKEFPCQRCGADKLNIKPKSLNITSKIPKSTSSKVKVGTYTPISIGFDFTTFKKPDSMKESTFSNLKSILKETRVEFSKLLQVVHKEYDLSGQLDIITSFCDLDDIGKNYPDFLKENDLIIFPMMSSELGESAVAGAGACLIDEDNRPLAGVLYINNEAIEEETKNWELYTKNVLLHEITHVLGFSSYFFPKLEMQTYDGSSYFINSPKVLEKAREYFNCSELKGVPLEDQGGKGSAGSHWEARYMYGDYMNAEALPEVVISDISLALLEDTGFYKVNYFSGGLFKFGKNKGCKFLNL